MNELDPEEVRLIKTKKENVKRNQQLKLNEISAKTDNQRRIFDLFDEEKNIFIHGFPGTGKSFVATYLALEAVEDNKYRQVIIVRSAVPSRRQGFLPGDEEEKNEIFEIPYQAIVNDLYGRGDAYKLLKSHEKVKFLSTSYLRGITLDDAVVIVDEVQNLNAMEIHTIVTRLGENCRLLLLGDTGQNDLLFQHEDSCIEMLKKRVKKMQSFETVEMGIDDICRNKVVREWILADADVS